jgi:hypothetical protein
MKHASYLLLCCFFIFSCNTNSSVPNTDIDVAREFIQAIQRSNFKEAEKLLLKDDTNKQFLESFEEHFKTRPKEELEKYKKADFIVNKMDALNDSVTIINYSNDFSQDEKNDLKIVKVDGQWLVDFKYTFPKK